MLIIRNLTLSFTDKTLFDDISLSLAYNKKIGVFGRNGAGKSTLLKVIAQQQEVDSGSIVYNKNKKIGYLPQEVVLNSTQSVFDEAYSTFSEFVLLEKEKQSIEEKLNTVADAQEAEQLIDRYATVTEQLAHFDSHAARKDTEDILQGLGFSEDRFNQPVNTLSTGWQMRVILTKLLLQKADLYLFDEPTNHLDLPTKEWFISFLRQANFGYLLVTHDKYFLEQACDTILELERGKATLFVGNFSTYCTQKEKTRKIMLAAYKQQQKEVKRKQITINRFRASATKAVMVQSMIKELGAMEQIEIEPPLPTVQFSFGQIVRAGKVVLTVDNVGHSFGNHTLFKNASCTIMRGQKVALIAPNGVGKTTLFNLIVGKLPLQHGSTEFGHNVTTAYFEQDQTKELNKNHTILEEVSSACSNIPEGKIRNFLGSFLFSGDEVQKKIGPLSGGEKNRVAMVKVLLQNANFLLLDEPTNHLDIYAKEVLLQALQQYEGTMLFVSHDHEFIQKVADTILELTPNGLYSHNGDYESFLYHKNSLNAHQQKENPILNEKKPKNSKQEYSLKKKLRSIETQIKKLENKKNNLNEQLITLHYSDQKYHEIVSNLKDIEQELTRMSENWEEIANQLA